MSSVREIARNAGVSITTVSRALNNDTAVSAATRDRILTIANAVGYVPAVGRRVTTNLALMYTQEVTLAHPFDSAVLDGMYRGVAEQRFDIVVLNAARDKRRNENYTQFFMRKNVRAVILRTMSETRHVCKSIASEGFPHVVISERFDEPDVNFIDGESHTDSVRAIEYLVALGHRRIAFAMHAVPDRDHLDRFEGYRIALHRCGLNYDDSLVLRYPFTIAGGATVMKLISAMPDRPTAIFFADPLLSVGAVKEAHNLGVRIPRDLSVIGFDDTDMRYAVHPTLTAVCQNAAALGYEAARWLTRRLDGDRDGHFRETVPTTFEINDSTAPPPSTS